jgi:hypothetical protein
MPWPAELDTGGGADVLFNQADVLALQSGHGRKPKRHRDGWDGQRRLSASARPHCYSCGGPLNRPGTFH